MPKPRVSVIITSYDKAPFLREAIQSVLNQTFKDFELIIIDDNSTDDSPQVIAAAKKNDKRVVSLKTDLDPTNHEITCCRYAHNINIALKYAEGEFITYLCDDDLYYPDRLERMVTWMDQNKGIDCCYGIQEILNLEKGRPDRKGLRDAPKILWDACYKVDHSSFMHRATVLATLGGTPYWNEHVSYWRIGDCGFFEKFRDAAIPLVRINGDKPTDIHRYNQLSVSYRLDHPDEVPGPNAHVESEEILPVPKYPPVDDQGNIRTIENAVDAGWTHLNEYKVEAGPMKGYTTNKGDR